MICGCLQGTLTTQRWRTRRSKSFRFLHRKYCSVWNLKKMESYCNVENYSRLINFPKETLTFIIKIPLILRRQFKSLLKVGRSAPQRRTISNISWRFNKVFSARYIHLIRIQVQMRVLTCLFKGEKKQKLFKQNAPCSLLPPTPLMG